MTERGTVREKFSDTKSAFFASYRLLEAIPIYTLRQCLVSRVTGHLTY